MNISDDLDFDQWFDIFLDQLKKLGYDGPVDKYTFEFEWETGRTPEGAAEEFFLESKS